MATACSPEASRARGIGPGADPGNRGSIVDVRGETDPAHDTPYLGKAIQTQRGK